MATVVTEPQTKHADRMIMPSSSQTTCRGQGSDLPFAHAQFTRDARLTDMTVKSRYLITTII